MKRLVLFMAFLLVAIISFNTVTGISSKSVKSPFLIFLDEWKEYKSDKDKCKISFPMEYKVTEKNDQTTVECTMGTEVFMFFHSTIQGATGTDVKIAEEALKTFAKSMKGKIKKENAYNFNEYKGKKAVIYLKEYNKMYAHYIVILGKNALYQLVGMNTSETPSENINKFFGSFIIMK